MADKPLLIVLAHDDPETRESLLGSLARLGYRVVSADGGGGLAGLCRSSPPGLVIADAGTPGLGAVGAPVILVSAGAKAPCPAACNVLAHLIKPVGEAQLRASVHLALSHSRRCARLREEAEGLRRALEARKVIEAAKGAVMRRVGVDEQTAFRRLRKRASSTSQKLVEVAREVLAAEEVFRLLDGE
jgi:response regulator NasT